MDTKEDRPAARAGAALRGSRGLPTERGSNGEIPLDNEADRALVRRAAEGDLEAFEALYRSHARAAWRAARGVAANSDDAADAVAEAFTKILRAVRSGHVEQITHFRAYLLTATRNAALDRRRGREDAFDATSEVFTEPAAMEPTPVDVVIDLTDESFVVEAYRQLPKRWQEVLWLTEVEGRGPKEVADDLGMTANAVAQLAFRARSGLRDQYVRAHLNDAETAACRGALDRLGAFVSGGLTTRGEQAVRQHLDACADCSRQLSEIEALPIPRPAHSVVLPLVLLGGAVRKFAGRVGFVGRRSRNVVALGRAAAAGVAATVAIGGLGLPGSQNAQSDPAPRPQHHDAAPTPSSEVSTTTTLGVTPTGAVETAAVSATHSSVPPGTETRSDLTQLLDTTERLLNDVIATFVPEETLGAAVDAVRSTAEEVLDDLPRGVGGGLERVERSLQELEGPGLSRPLGNRGRSDPEAKPSENPERRDTQRSRFDNGGSKRGQGR